ncbi:MAG: DUF4912 domain-containing protein [Limisphaerales bacterium]
MKTKASPLLDQQKTNARTARDAIENHVETNMTPSSETSGSSSKPKRSSAKKIKDTIASAIETVTSPLKSHRPKAKAVEPEVKVSAETRVRRTYTRKKKIEPPKILLEGDETPVPAVGGPGRKFELGPESSAASPKSTGSAEGELPEAYGTKKIFLTARDPHWLYANWDLTQEQQAKYNTRSADGHLVVRIYANAIEGHPLYEIHVHPESRHWFAHVERAGASYAAELGFYSSVGRWTRVGVSALTVTPPDAVSAEDDIEFATIPFEFPFARLMELVKAAVMENYPLARAIEELRRAGHPELPRNARPGGQWTPQQEQALAKVVSIDPMRRVWMGSMEITELIRRRLAQEISSMGISSFGVSSFSSPLGGVEKKKGFWFNVNAELIIYGATEPDAKVSLGGHEIRLRPDGSFSYRFSLPDGKYDLPAVAISADGTDGRAAELKFSRDTQYRGDVGAHPQDPSLRPPVPESV